MYVDRMITIGIINRFIGASYTDAIKYLCRCLCHSSIIARALYKIGAHTYRDHSSMKRSRSHLSWKSTWALMMLIYEGDLNGMFLMGVNDHRGTSASSVLGRKY